MFCTIIGSVFEQIWDVSKLRYNEDFSCVFSPACLLLAHDDYVVCAGGGVGGGGGDCQPFWGVAPTPGAKPLVSSI